MHNNKQLHLCTATRARCRSLAVRAAHTQSDAVPRCAPHTDQQWQVVHHLRVGKERRPHAPRHAQAAPIWRPELTPTAACDFDFDCTAQTGSGKTFTIYGSERDAGLTPRGVRELFRIVERDSAKFNFSVSLYMLELYQVRRGAGSTRPDTGNGRRCTPCHARLGCFHISVCVLH